MGMKIYFEERDPPINPETRDVIRYVLECLGLITNNVKRVDYPIELLTKIMRRTRTEDYPTVEEIALEMGVLPQSLHVHLRKMKRMGLVTKIKGNRYRLSQRTLAATLEYMYENMRPSFMRVAEVASIADKEMVKR